MSQRRRVEVRQQGRETGWDRIRIAVSELSLRRSRKVFKKKRRAVVEGPVLAVELVGTVLWMAWESARGVHVRGGVGKGRRQRSRQRQSWQ